MAVKIIGTTSGVEADVTANKELFVSRPADRLTAYSGIYLGTSGTMTLGTTTANTALFCLDNPTASGRYFYILRLTVVFGFSGNNASTYTSFGVSRATGTSAAGSGNKVTSAIAKARSTHASSVATYRWGPTAITGLTDDASGDFRSWFTNHQLGTPMFAEMLDDWPNDNRNDPLVLDPATSLVIRNRTNAVAGSNVAINVKWMEVTV